MCALAFNLGKRMFQYTYSFPRSGILTRRRPTLCIAKRDKLFRLLLPVVMTLLTLIYTDALHAGGMTEIKRPNILLILADDLGYSDIGVYGSEIETPHIDALARNGVLFKNFYTGATCGPTRSMLMSGTDNHIAGTGVNAAGLLRLTWLQGRPGYEGYLNDRVVTFARQLQDVGYHTYMTGKWDLGSKKGYLPVDRGFDRSFALIEGGASHFEDAMGNLSAQPKATYYEDSQKVEKLPKGFYSSEFYTDRLIDYIDANKHSGQPFLGYLAFTAPHWPLQAPDDWIDKYNGRYDAGWDALRQERLRRMQSMGLIADNTPLPPRVDRAPAWESLGKTAKEVEARKMEIYAAMVSNMDHHIGRLIQYLKDTGRYDNTFIVFASDNGAEGNNIGSILDGEYWVPATFDNRLENMGRIGSYLWPDAGWGQVSATPKRLYKSFTSEGGINVPAIISYPGMLQANQRTDTLATVMDVAPTLLELAGTQHPGEYYRGRKIASMRGKSMLPYLNGKAKFVHSPEEPLGWETYGSRALRQGDWKILWVWPPYGPGRWELFNLGDDPGETADLSDVHPEKLDSLISLWQQYVSETDMVVFDQDTGYGRQ